MAERNDFAKVDLHRCRFWHPIASIMQLVGPAPAHRAPRAATVAEAAR